MCLQPKSIINRSKYLNLHGDKLYNVIPCNECIECQDERINAYLARADAEMKLTNEKNGLCYVDTFTYNDTYLPLLTRGMNVIRNDGEKANTEHIYRKGIPIFCRDDVRDTFVRLRMALERAGYYDLVPCERIKKDGTIESYTKKVVRIKHFCTTEYGGQWHRPHYHVLFFIQHPISHQEFEKMLQDAWQYGNLDYYKKVKCDDGSVKVIRKTSYDKVVNGPAALHYVAKYVVKDDDYFDYLCDSFYDGESTKKPLTLREKCKYLQELLPENIFKGIHPRPFVSNYFGISLANKYTYDPNRGYVYSDMYQFMYDNGIIEVKNKAGVITNICKIPQYIQRKLWYEPIKDFDGSIHWQLSEDGLTHKLDRVAKSVELLTDRYINIFQNIGNFYENPCDELNLTRQNELLSLLNGRSFEDFVIYKLFYKGSLYLCAKDLDRDIYVKSAKGTRKFTDSEFDLLSGFDLFGDFHTLIHKLFKVTNNDSFLPNNYPGEIKCSSEYVKRRYLIQLLERYYSIDQNSDIAFEDFDKLDKLLDTYQHFRNKILKDYRDKCYQEKKKEKLLDPIYKQHEINNLRHRQSILQQIKDIRYGFTC